MAIHNIHHGKLAIPRQPATLIHYSYVPGSSQVKQGSRQLTVFLSGLNDPRTIWTPVLRSLNEDWERGIVRPAMVLYDRFGCGETAKRHTGGIHDAMDAAKDLREFLVCISRNHLKTPTAEFNDLHIIFVAHSFGGVVAELYAKLFSRTVIALLFLDPSPTDTDGESWFPDPDAPDFKPEAIPNDITASMLRKARAQQRSSPYNPNSPNKEGMKWDNLSTYIPVVGKPELTGPRENTPLLTIMTHDPPVYAKQVEKLIGTPASVTLMYNSQAWFAYLQKLAYLVPPHLQSPLIVAKGSGHFIPLEQPRFVAAEIKKILQILQLLPKVNNSKL